MIASMTGYGRESFANDNIKINVELKSVNSKQLDLLIRIPSLFREQELYLRNRLAPLFERGKIDLTVTYENLKGVSPVKINKDVIRSYKQQIETLTGELDIPVPQDWVQILFRLPEALTADTREADDEEKDLLVKTVMAATDNFIRSRINEGKGLYKFFIEKISHIREFLMQTDGYEKERVKKVREKLELQLSHLQGVEIDRGRLEQELIFYIEKLDVSEEKQRLRSHLDYFEDTLGDLNEKNIVGKGKKLGFISQEIGREINTLGSKSNDADMQRLVVMMKDELEQIKEQVLNVL